MDNLLGLLGRNPLQREIYLELLNWCEVRRGLEETERMVSECPGFSLTAQSPFALISNLVDGGGIDWFEIDADGLVITEERKVGLSDDEADDLVEGFALQTTDAGRIVAQEMAPERRLENLFREVPHRATTFLDVIDLCKTPQPFKAVEEFLATGAQSSKALGPSAVSVQPSYFVDMLERAGALVWDKGWRATKGGSIFAAQARLLMAG